LPSSPLKKPKPLSTTSRLIVPFIATLTPAPSRMYFRSCAKRTCP
jgi:hypothetical protein